MACLPLFLFPLAGHCHHHCLVKVLSPFFPFGVPTDAVVVVPFWNFSNPLREWRHSILWCLGNEAAEAPLTEGVCRFSSSLTHSSALGRPMTSSSKASKFPFSAFRCFLIHFPLNLLSNEHSGHTAAAAAGAAAGVQTRK